MAICLFCKRSSGQGKKRSEVTECSVFWFVWISLRGAVAVLYIQNTVQWVNRDYSGSLRESVKNLKDRCSIRAVYSYLKSRDRIKMMESSWWGQNIWQGINGCTEACRAQIRCEEKPYPWVGSAICLTEYSTLSQTKPWQSWAGAGSTPALGRRLLRVTTGGVFQPVSLWLASLCSKESNLFLWSSILKFWSLAPVSCSQPWGASHPMNSWGICAICGCAPAVPSSQTICKMLLIALYAST